MTIDIISEIIIKSFKMLMEDSPFGAKPGLMIPESDDLTAAFQIR